MGLPMLALTIDSGEVAAGVVVVLVAAVAGVLANNYNKGRIRAQELEKRAIVDRAVALALKAVEEKIDTGNGKTLGQYVHHMSQELSGLRDDVKDIGTKADQDRAEIIADVEQLQTQANKVEGQFKDHLRHQHGAAS